MKQITSKKITLKQQLTINECLSIHLLQKEYKGTIYILHNHETIKTTKLPTLVTFSLLTTANSEITVIVEGLDAETTLENVCELFNQQDLLQAQ
ncbi:HPr family phosphocarrier protein [Gracilibacillus marinus]|jgi:phosphotransferase system HPr-like phosphotransfer protein|uniref:HPr family phosphocarrier protein n=1 Tax=Gracilibacillus marinus TaxID=630535 RepID=A0ABV8VZF1_9BACI